MKPIKIPDTQKIKLELKLSDAINKSIEMTLGMSTSAHTINKIEDNIFTIIETVLDDFFDVDYSGN